MTTIITGQGVRVYQAMAIRSALNLYLNTGMKANSAYTPRNMVAAAEHITGEHYGSKANATSMKLAMAGLARWIEVQKNGPCHVESN